MFKLLNKIGIWNALLFSDEKVTPIDKCQKIVEILVPIITTIGLIGTAFYTGNEYFKQEQNRREDKTLELYTKQLDGELLKSRIQLDVFYNKESRTEYLKIVTAGDLKKMEEFSSQFSKKNYKHIMIIANFYKGIVKCVKKNICDSQTAEALFKDDIKDFVVMFGPFFCNFRKDLKNDTIMSDLEHFSPPKKRKLCKEDNTYSREMAKVVKRQSS